MNTQERITYLKDIVRDVDHDVVRARAFKTPCNAVLSICENLGFHVSAIETHAELAGYWRARRIGRSILRIMELLASPTSPEHDSRIVGALGSMHRILDLPAAADGPEATDG